MHNIKNLLILCALVICFIGCGENIETAQSQNPALVESSGLISDMSVSNNDVLAGNLGITKSNITITASIPSLTPQYDYLRVNISNNSEFDFTFAPSLKIYEKTGDEYVFISDIISNNNMFTVNAGTTNYRLIYLGEIMTNDLLDKGSYKLEIPINYNECIDVEFEVSEDYIQLDTGISIKTEKDIYNIGSDENFTYTIINNSDEDISATLTINVSKFVNGEWVNIKCSSEYFEVHYYAGLNAQTCKANSEFKQEFALPLAEMLDAKLSRDLYRIEKEINMNWYYYEFEIN